MARTPDGIFFSNGPGDPATADHAVGLMSKALEAGRPVFGICFGNQIFGRALGLSTLQVALRPSRHQPTGEGSDHWQGGDHRSQPRVRCASAAGGGIRQPLRTCAGLPRVLERRRRRGTRARGRICLQCAVPPRGGSWSSRCRVSLRSLRGSHRATTGWWRLMPRRSDIESVMVIGSGPIVIGQGVRIRITRARRPAECFGTRGCA